jgi:hypothetical protein
VAGAYIVMSGSTSWLGEPLVITKRARVLRGRSEDGTGLTFAVLPQLGDERTFTQSRLKAVPDPLRTILRLGHVADGAIVPTANDGRNRFGKFSAPVGSKSRKRTFLRMTPSFHWTATDLCSDRFADPVPVEGGTLVKRRHMTVSVVS